MDEFQNLPAMQCLDSVKEVGLICDGWHLLLFCRVVFLFLTLFFACLFVCFFDHVIFACLGQWSVSFLSKDPVGVCHFSLLESS